MKSTDFSAKSLCLGALFLALGILLPQGFHMIGGSASGGLLLPMHIPVFLCGLILGPVYGVITGFFSPLLSFLFTGMPPFAKLPFMVIELSVYGLVSGFLAQKGKNIYISLIAAQISGRLANALILFLASALLHLKVPPVMSVVTALATGIPGIIVQLVFIPILAVMMRKAAGYDKINYAG